MSESSTETGGPSAAADSPAPAAAAPASEGVAADPPKLSKKAMKKKRRYEKAMEIKRRRKEQEREQKRARALAAGRDLDEERRIQKQNEESGEGWRRREKKWLAKLEGAKRRFRIAVDCGFEKEMTKKEINSLAQQLRYCYAANKRSMNPCYFTVAGLSGLTRQHCDNVCGFPEQWLQRAFDFSEKPLEEMHADEKDKLVYLTSDSDHTLEHLDDSKIYVIGGIVDRNRLKYATLNRATALGVATAKLPISQHLKLFSTNVLTTNHVFEILLKYRENNNCWKQALVDVLPKRKEIKEINDGEADEEKEDGDTVGTVEKAKHVASESKGGG
jgi:tRNA (guanine9-N1)-methyltransferase